MRASAVVAALTLAVAPAWAHDTWLLPSQFQVQPGVPITADATSAMRFPEPEIPVRPERIVRRGVRVADQTRELTPGASTKAALSLRAVVEQPAVAVLWMESLPRTLEMKDSQVEEYLKEIGAWDTVGAKWREGGRKPWRETYAKCAKAFVRVGEPPADRSWAAPVGLALELVPETDPTAVLAGESLRFKVLRNGRPIAGQAVAAQGAGREPVLRHADSDGGVTFVLDHPGPWLVKATDIQQGARPGDWESRFSTVTFAVKAAR